jgi:hypothetical protein
MLIFVWKLSARIAIGNPRSEVRAETSRALEWR